MNNVESVSHAAKQLAYDEDPVTCYNNIKMLAPHS